MKETLKDLAAMLVIGSGLAVLWLFVILLMCIAETEGIPL